jgi:RNA polymerase sigma-70 factor (ECF subfamily)
MERSVDCGERADEELVGLVLQEKAYFSCLIVRYEERLRRYVRRITNISEDDIDDVLQDIFIKIYTNLEGFDRNLSFSSWVYRIAHNAVISGHRKRSVRPEGHMADVDDDVLLNIVGDGDVEHDIDTQYLRQHLLSAMDEISPKYKDVLVLRFFEEKEYQEISDILQKPPGSVATLINRAKTQLREAFIKQGYSRHDYER